MFKSSWIHPAITDEATAKKAARQGVWACGIIAGATLILYFLTYADFNPFNLDEYALIDISLFTLIGWGIYRMSRVAAISGLLLYALEQVVTWMEFGFKPSVHIVLISMAFANSIRATFAFQRFSESAIMPTMLTMPTGLDSSFASPEKHKTEESKYCCGSCGRDIPYGESACPSCGELLEYT